MEVHKPCNDRIANVLLYVPLTPPICCIQATFKPNQNKIFQEKKKLFFLILFYFILAAEQHREEFTTWKTAHFYQDLCY